MIKVLMSFLQTTNSILKTRTVGRRYINLVGRNFLRSTDLHTEDIKSFLWTAMDLKYMFTQKCCEVDNIKLSRITMLMHEPSMEIQASAHSAANLLKAHLNTVIDPVWCHQEFINDIGSFFSTCSDMIFCKSKYQSKIEKLAEGSVIPVVCVESCVYAVLHVLADMMTFQERFGHLQHLNIGWIGKPCPLINTYLCIAPKLGINVQYHCTCKHGQGMSPATLPVAKAISQKKHTSVFECKNSSAAINKANVIIVSKHDVPDCGVNLKRISEKADKHWSFLHPLPRGSVEVQPEVFDHKNSLVWEAKGNLQWIYASFMLRLLSKYKHFTERPTFNKDIKRCL